MGSTAVMPSIVRVTDLSVRYNANGTAGAEVLRRVSFAVSEGETLLVLGPNGSGKSTLLHAIAGALDGVVRGDVQVLGRTVLGEPRHRRARAIAMVHQDPSRGSAAHLTLREHCELTAAMAGRRRVTWDQVGSRLESLGSAMDSGQLAGELSGGQRQLFTVLLAVLSAPRVLLLDEPTAALDGRHAALVLDAIRESSGEDTATIMVTHDLSEARQIGDRLLVLNARGEVQVISEPAAKAALDEAGLRDLLTQASATTWTQRLLQPSGSDEHRLE